MPHSEEQLDTESNGKRPKNYSVPFSSTFADRCAVNFGKLKPSALMFFDKVLERVQGLKNFSKFHLNVNENDIYGPRTLAMCTYLEAISSIMSQFEVKLIQLDKDHAEIKKIKENVAEVEELMAQGKDLIAKEKYNEAIEIQTEALQIRLTGDPIIIYEVLYNRAMAYSKIGHFRNAINDCTNILETKPTKSNALLLRAQCYDFLDEYEQCIRDYEVALLVTDADRNEEVRLKLEKVIKKKQHKLAEEKNAMGDLNFNSKSYRLAEQQYSEAIELWPSNLLFYGNRCESRYKLGDYKRAHEDSKNIVETDPTIVTAFVRMAKCSLILSDYDNAELAVNSLILNNYNVKICNDLNDLCKQLQNCELRAIHSFDRKKYLNAVSIVNEALKLLPKSVTFKLFKAKCFLHLGNAKKIKKLENAYGLSEAEQFYIKAIRMYCEGDLVEALSYLDQALRFDPNHDKSNHMLNQIDRLNAKKLDGDEMYAARNFHRSVELYTEALDGDMPKNAFYCELQYSRGKAQSKMGNFYDAISDCDNVLSIQENHIRALLLRAECHEYLDDYRQSIQDYETLLRIDKVIKNDNQYKLVTSKMQNLKVTLVNQEKALEQKRYGDEKFEANDYQEALELYANAIALWPQNVSFYKNRIDCFMKLRNYIAVVKDCQTAVQFDKIFFKDYGRMIDCYLIIGDISSAERAIKKCVEAGSHDRTVRKYNTKLFNLRQFKQNAVTYYKQKLFRSALSAINGALEIAFDSLDFKLMKAEYLVALNRFKEANVIAVSCMQSNPTSAEAVYIRALCIYRDDWEQGLKCLENVIRLDPDHSKAKAMISKIRTFQKEEEIASKLLQEENYREAHEHINEALKISPVNSKFFLKLLYNRAFTHSKTGFFRDAIKDCTRALKKSWAISNCLRLRANCYMAMRKFQSAISDYEELLKIEKSNEVKNKLKEAKQALQRYQSDNYYDVLEIENTATKADIKKAYRRLALIHHPDKHSDAPNDEKIEQQEICKKINVAHQILSDSEKRKEYDLECENNNSS